LARVTTDTAARIRALLAHSPVIDGHNDFAWELRSRVRYDLDALDVTADQTESGLHTDLARMRAGGMGAQFWSVFVTCEMAGDEAVTATLEQIDFVHRLSARYPDKLAIARTADEVESIFAAGRIASLIGVEGGHSINNSMGVLRMLHALGARYMTLTHVKNTAWADSATDEPVVGGLSDFGREVVRECNRLGVMADLSHVAPSTMHAALDVSTAPAFFSHSSARALCDHPRNVPDDVLARVRDTDGVVMVTFVPGFLNEECHRWMDALIDAEQAITAEVPEDSPEWKARRAKWAASNPRPACGIDDVADHIEHVRAVAGAAAVGIGSDFDGIIETPDGVTDVSTYPALLATLADRGWSDAELAGLTWRNALRVLRATEAASRAATWEPSVLTF
jgi:membrane dipeptidase